MVKSWLDFLIDTPLYHEYGVTIDQWFLNDTALTDDMVDDVHVKVALINNQDGNDLIIKPIDNDPSQVKSLLLAKQYTILWNEEKYLLLTPGMNPSIVTLDYDKHAKELLFPEI